MIVIFVKSEMMDGLVVKENSFEFEDVVKGGDMEVLIKFCEVKKCMVKGEEYEVWTFMSILFIEDVRREMLCYFEFGDVLEVCEKFFVVLLIKDIDDL